MYHHAQPPLRKMKFALSAEARRKMKALRRRRRRWVMHWMFLKVVADAGTHEEEEEEKEEHEGADFLQDTLTFHSAPQLEPR